MFIPQTIQDELLLKLSNNSVKLIDYVISKIFKQYLNKCEYNCNDIISNIDQIIENIIREELTTRKRNIYYGLLWIAKIEKLEESIIDKINLEYDKVQDIHNKEYKYRDFDVKHYVSLETIHSLINRHNNAHLKMVLSLYALFPALRGQDLYNTMIYTSDQNSNIDYKLVFNENNYNFYDKTHGVLVIGDHKTKRSYGIKIIKMPLNVRCLFDNIVIGRDTGHLLLDIKGRPYNSVSFCQILNSFFTKMCNKLISVDDLRKIYIAEVLSYINTTYNLTDKKSIRFKMADIMGHSITCQEFFYSSFIHNSDIKLSSKDYMSKVLDTLVNTDIVHTEP